MNKKKLTLLVSTALAGLSPVAGFSAAVDTEPDNNTFAAPNTWTWQTDNQNIAELGLVGGVDLTDFFQLSGFTPGSQVRVTFELRNNDNGPIRLEIFDTTQVQGDNVSLSSVLDTLDLAGTNAGTTGTVAAPANSLLGLKVTKPGEIGVEGYRITIEVLSAPVGIPVPAWPAVPLLGAAALAELRRRQKRKVKSREA